MQERCKGHRTDATYMLRGREAPIQIAATKREGNKSTRDTSDSMVDQANPAALDKAQERWKANI